ncbi:hypothetical protein CR194_17660 [Salipaludibacillus keqinensis]|uniref:Uncharacterized protein n=1 Tax=Salipaludibacillus keqinensis TaxID=2045207 RepID=A0A323THD9_9BACI|nr:hypothetical protein [Salipaludibacillus keqinensis]PYZ92023.1 hypothetical protein CR194_17660 [Salipaludibacillus keqinensis]
MGDLLNAVLFILVLLAIIGSIAAWMNTKQILEELRSIKKELGMKTEKKRGSFIDNDLDSDDNNEHSS